MSWNLFLKEHSQFNVLICIFTRFTYWWMVIHTTAVRKLKRFLETKMQVNKWNYERLLQKSISNIGIFLSSQIAKIFFGQNDVLSVSNIDYLCVVCMWCVCKVGGGSKGDRRGGREGVVICLLFQTFRFLITIIQWFLLAVFALFQIGMTQQAFSVCMILFIFQILTVDGWLVR